MKSKYRMEPPGKKLKETATIIMGQSPPGSSYNKFGDGLPFYQGVKDFGRRFPIKRVYCNKPKKIANKDDILFSVRAPIGRINIATEKCAIGRGLAIIRSHEKYDSFFIENLLTFLEQKWNNLEGGGTVFGNAKRDDLELLAIPWPELNIRKKIGQTLTNLTFEIENLYRRNTVSEKIIQSVFKSWFIDFDGQTELVDSELGQIPKGWNVRVLPEVTRIVDCLHITKPPEVENDAYLLQVFNIVDLGLIDISKKYYVSNEDYQFWTKNIEVHAGDCIISNAGRVGAVAQIPYWLRGGIGRNITALRPTNVTPTYLLEYLFSRLGQQEIVKQTDAATVFNTLNVRGIKKIRILIPEQKLMEDYEKISRPLRKILEYNAVAILNLTKIRDSLLPKLMSGEIQV